VWGTSSYGDFNIYPTGSAPAAVSTLNWGPGTLALANAAVIPLGTSGAITVLNESPGTVDLFFDVNGYYAGTQATGGGTFNLYTDNSFAIWGESTAASFGYGTIGRALGGTTGIGAFGRGSQWGVYGTTQGSTAIGVYGDSTGSNGVQGVTTAGGVAGVLGGNNTATDGSHGVGGYAGGAAKVYGVQGQISSSATGESAGVHGIGAGTTPISYGVLGESGTNTFSSAGVKGVDGGGPPAVGALFSSGVLGESNNANGYGIAGVSKFVGGVGFLVNSSGTTLATGVLGTTLSAGPWGVYAFGNIGASGTKPFVEVHPTDPNKLIRYVALEGPEAGTYFRGRGRFNGGIAVIQVPESFRLVSAEEGLTVQITPIGRQANVSVTSANLNEIVVEGSSDVEFYYHVNGVRETFKDWQVIVDDGYVPMNADARIPAYFSPAQQQRLIANGTYNADGTVNMRTAERLGWAQKWRDAAEAQAKTAAQARAAEQASPGVRAANAAASQAGTRSQTP
jgi:hypothetical protein